MIFFKERNDCLESDKTYQKQDKDNSIYTEGIRHILINLQNLKYNKSFLKIIFYLFIFKQQFLISYLFYTYWCIYVNPNLPVHLTTTTTPATFPSWCPYVCSLHLCLAFLPCKLVHLYNFSRFHIYALIFDICFSLSDLLHSV